MKGLIKKIIADKIIKLGTYFSIVLILLHLIFVLIFFTFMPPYIPIFNQMPWGEDRLGTRIEVFLPILITISFFVLNFFLAHKIYDRMPLLARILIITSLIISGLSMIFIARTVLLVV